MAGRPRKDVIREDEVGVYHVWSRCVRRAMLCGFDPLTGTNYDYRKKWIYQRLAELSQIFAVDALVFAILSNHYHLLLRNRPDLAAQWSDEEVVRRWWQLHPERRDENGEPAEPTDLEIASLVADTKLVAERRRQLSSISCLMKNLNEWIAKRANTEEGLSGHFFQERFKCRSLLDEGAILACSIYIDLNEIRALLAATPETSTNTSAYYRILARIKRQLRQSGQAMGDQSLDQQPDDPDAWLCPIGERDRVPLLGPAGVESVATSQRVLAAAGASNSDPACEVNLATVFKQWRHGFLDMTVDSYLEFLDWNARRVVPGKAGAMDDSLPPILERLGMTAEFWLQMIENFDRWFRTAAGSPQKLADEAARRGRRWLPGIGPMRGAVG
jgi:hypothetical protein